MPTSLVTCENLVKIYKVQEANVEVVALQGLDLEVEMGEMLALVGQSGSGKTTLLNVLGALDVPSAGRCTVAGHDLTRLNEKQRNEYRRFVTGQVWQQSGRNLIPDLTTLDNVSLPQMLGGAGAGTRARRSSDLLKMVGLGDMRKRYPNELSGGEQQRAAIAVALANEPDLLLADEPTGELDSVTAREIVALLRGLNEHLGLTIILVTHDVAVAAGVDRTITIRDGKTSTETIRREAPPRAWHAAPQTASAIIGLPADTHRESVLIDRTGWLQLPEEAVRRIAFNGRAEVRMFDGHVEIWPLDGGE